MKKLLSILFLLPLFCNALVTTYYFSATGNDATGNGTIGNPYQTLSKANALGYAAGSTLSFNGGDYFFGSLVIVQNNITANSYGTGQAYITGLITLSGWTNAGGGVWQKSVTLKNALNIVTINGIPQEVGRWPNSDAANGGYITPTGYSTNTTYTAPELSATNWAGAEVVARKQAYKFERDRITSQSATTITYAQTIKTINSHTGATPAPLVPPFGVGFGIFIQKDLRTLDKQGEWFYDSAAHVLSMFFGANNPASYTVQGSNVDTIINITNHTGTTITNLNISGGNMAAIYWDNATGTTVTNCTIPNNLKPVFGWYSSNLFVDNNIITWGLCGGIDIREYSQSNIIVTNNKLTNIAIYKGFIDQLDGADANGIYVQSVGARVAFNQIDSVGYNGIHFEGNYVAVDSNFVNHYCYNLADGGGIYTFPSGSGIMIGRQIIGNIVINAFDPVIGTGEQTGSNPIYCDGGTSGVNVFRNSVSGSPGAGVGLFLNSPKNMNIQNNTIYNCWGWYTGRQENDSMFNVTIKNNIIYSINPAQKVVQFTHGGLNTTTRYTSTGIQNALQQIGIVDSNYYNVQNAQGFKWYYRDTNTSGWIFPPEQNLSYWKTYTGLDAHSTETSFSAQSFQYNYSSSPTAFNFSGLSKKDIRGNIYNNSATIPAYSSLILIDNGTTTLPTVSAGSNQTIVLPIATVNLSGTVTLGSGTITSTVWTQTAGTAATITTPNNLNTTVTGLTTSGVRTFTLTVTDSTPSTVTSPVNITVNSAIIPGTRQYIIGNIFINQVP